MTDDVDVSLDEVMERIKAAVKDLAKSEYPRVWIGEPGMTPEEYFALEEQNAASPEWLQVHPGEFVEIEGSEGAGIPMPKIGYEYLDGLWVIENMRDELDEATDAELTNEVLHIWAAKRGEVVIIIDIQERYEADLPPVFRRVPVDMTPPKHARDVLEVLEFYAADTMGPYVIADSERARAALEERLEG